VRAGLPAARRRSSMGSPRCPSKWQTQHTGTLSPDTQDLPCCLARISNSLGPWHGLAVVYESFFFVPPHLGALRAERSLRWKLDQPTGQARPGQAVVVVRKRQNGKEWGR
jgi:hypothetical protein